MKNVPRDKALYEKVKESVYKEYDRPSAYRSGALVRRYKEEFLKKYGSNVKPYEGDRDKGDLTRWFKENWKDLAGLSYPVYRPTIRVDKKTPLTVGELDREDAQRQALLKQIYKDKKNLPPFKKRVN